MDAERLPAETRERLQALAREPRRATATAIGADLPHYELTIEDGEHVRTIGWDDDGGEKTAELRALAEAVQLAEG